MSVGTQVSREEVLAAMQQLELEIKESQDDPAFLGDLRWRKVRAETLLAEGRLAEAYRAATGITR